VKGGIMMMKHRRVRYEVTGCEYLEELKHEVLKNIALSTGLNNRPF